MDPTGRTGDITGQRPQRGRSGWPVGREGTRTIAIVLAGAVARGAFEAGAIQALASADIRIARIIGASAGALNAVCLASAVRTRDLRAGAEKLVAMWRDLSLGQVFHPSVRDWLKRDGLSDQKSLLATLREHIRPSQPADPAAIDLGLIVTSLRGCEGTIDARPATTFESLRAFTTQDFATAAGLEGVFRAATASAAFPGVFAPVEVADIGPCVDGGAVNNTPIKWALEGAIGAQIDAVVVVSTSVEHQTAPSGDPVGVALIGHILELLVEERLYRDLREAQHVNHELAALDELVRHGKITSAQVSDIKQALGWTGRRMVEVIPIRPTRPLAGNPFAGFVDGDLRREYVDAGYRRALEVMSHVGWGLRTVPSQSATTTS